MRAKNSPSTHHPLSVSHGFTIIELLVVIVVIGILVAIVVVSYVGLTQKAVVSSLQSDLGKGYQTLILDYATNVAYPNTLAAADNGKGVTASAGTTYQYFPDNSSDPMMFCLSATKDTTTYYVTNKNSEPIKGSCFDYGLVLSLDAGNSQSYPGSGTTWTDISPNPTSCTTSNAPTYTSGPPQNFNFNGSSNLYICPESSKLNTLTPTVEVWMKTSNINQFGFFFEKGQCNTQYSIFLEGGTIVWRQNLVSTGLTSLGALSGTYLDTSHWFQVVGTYTSGTRKLYVNGVLAASDGLTGDISTNANGESIGVLGGFNGGRGYYYTGNIGAVNVYNRALTSNEVLQKFNSQKVRFGY
ncbi:MAG: LamG domain-containing protein [Candidatus Saccharibacteria bacterium]|nr:LamG domain-containing protein [Candidatus Saccharibacteria bacterium]